jgi:hypothetical protein
MRAPPPRRDVSSRKVVPVLRRPLALFAVLALSLAACGEGEPEVEVTTPVEEPTDDVDEPADDDQATTDEGADEEVEDGADGGDATDGDATDGDEGPEPDPAALAAPCAGHEDRTGEGFIELVAPVEGQQVTDEVTIVGCSNVYEATVSWRLLAGDGETVDEGFTTAECGSGCVGAFEETIELGDDAAAEPTLALQVFWEDAADGSDRDVVEVELVVTG